MKKKIIIGIAILLILAGSIIIGTMGLKADIVYSKNVRIDIYIGKTFKAEEIKQMVNEVFGEGKTIVQEVEYYKDMASVTIQENNASNIEEKVEQLNNKINEKYGVENKKESIEVTHQPKVKLSTILMPYILPIAISVILILGYVMIRFRKIGKIKTIGTYLLAILASEAVYLSVIAITRIPIDRIVVPMGLLIYIVVITIVTTHYESKYHQYQEEIKK